MYKKKAEALFDYTVDIRRRMHTNPELSGLEEETVKLVKEELEKICIEYVEVNNGGVLAFIKGNKNLLTKVKEKSKLILLFSLLFRV